MVERIPASCGASPPTVVAIPAKDEAAQIADCLSALSAQVDEQGRRLPPGAFRVLLLLNDCRDDTAAVARGLSPTLPFALELVECSLPPRERHAGGARRCAMDAAAASLGRGGIILTTDADTRVAPDWIARHWALFRTGVGAVAGHVLADPAEYRRLTPALRRRDRLERRYALMVDELDARLDPLDHDPWPRHRAMAGASIGVTLAAYRAVGGLPAVASGEDRAFGGRLLRHGIAVRHALDVRVATSCRLVGRAARGMADTLSRRLGDPASPCDDRLESALDTAHRAFWRATVRHRHAAGELARTADWAEPLGIDPDLAATIAGLPRFGRVWSAIEWASPALRRRPLVPDALPDELRRVRRLLGWLRDARPGAAEPEDFISGRWLALLAC